LAAFAAGLEASFFVDAAFLVGAFLAAVLALDAAVVPVVAFLAGARLAAVVVFLVDEGLVALVLPARTFLVEEAGFLAEVVALGLAAVVVFLAEVVALALAVLDLAAGFFTVAAFGLAVVVVLALEAGLFSLAAESFVLALGATLTLPERPLGRIKTPLSTPVVMAFES